MADRLTTSYWPADESEPLLETTVPGVLWHAAEVVPDRVALVAGAPDPADRRRWTYADLLEEAERLAHGLVQQFERGERIAIWAPSEPEWIPAIFAISMAGLVLVPVNPAYRSGEIRRVLGQSGASAVFYTPEHRGNPMEETLADVAPELPRLRMRHRLADVAQLAVDRTGRGGLPEIGLDDITVISYTSGTTGVPKGACLRQQGLTNNARMMFGRLGGHEGAVWVNPNPMFHLGGCGLGTLGPTQFLGTHVLVPYWDPGLVLELLESEGATVTGGVPTMMIALLEHPDFPERDLSKMRSVSSGGSTVPADLVRRIEGELGVCYSTMFGQTEGGAGITQTVLDDSPEDKAETVGRGLPQVAVKIIDPVTGAIVRCGEVGELCAKSPMAMYEYWDMPAETAKAIDPEGWLHTGDLCTMDDRGYCRVVGRLKDMITRGGENIYPREIEDTLFADPSVGEAAVIGVPDERYGEQVAAFVRPAPGEKVDVEALRTMVRRTLAPYKTPTYWYVVDELPVNGVGKIQKQELLERWKSGDFA
jgi:fatty-acyl-CoA synthase